MQIWIFIFEVLIIIPLPEAAHTHSFFSSSSSQASRGERWDRRKKLIQTKHAGTVKDLFLHFWPLYHSRKMLPLLLITAFPYHFTYFSTTQQLILSMEEKRVWTLFARFIYLFNSIKSLSFDNALLIYRIKCSVKIEAKKYLSYCTLIPQCNTRTSPSLRFSFALIPILWACFYYNSRNLFLKYASSRLI